MKSYASEDYGGGYSRPRIRNDTLLKRWREGDKKLKGLYKSGLTPTRPKKTPLNRRSTFSRLKEEMT